MTTLHPNPLDHIGILVSVARRHWNLLSRQQQQRVGWEDFVADGMLPLLKKLRKYDPKRGAAVSTFLTISLTNRYRTVVTEMRRPYYEVPVLPQHRCVRMKEPCLPVLERRVAVLVPVGIQETLRQVYIGHKHNARHVAKDIDCVCSLLGVSRRDVVTALVRIFSRTR